MNRKLEIFVLPVEDTQKGALQEGLAVSGISDITQSLIGIIPVSDITIEQIKQLKNKKVMFDTNIILDLLLNRQSFCEM